ncbi:hypothetical protein MAR621_02995 [Maribacter dokdonensis]|uniref:hypothetical protein n=1 Tax=Maribacter dokdonensis TaxID=320912 RepID=UPI001B0C7D7D|nr:hypothetical protein [Maribacter dokdonensis]CAG2532801.1 hypothetical protein MAR621_02995 [Maribacter dokdonensis]
MRRLLLLLVIATVWCSCSSSGEADDFGMEMYYELTSLNSGMSGEILDKEELDFRESIEFFPDSTFIKQRVGQDSTSIASGKYDSVISDGNDYFKLNYSNDTYLIQTCGNSMVEYLRILSETEIYNGGYLPCDGPGYYYTRTKK